MKNPNLSESSYSIQRHRNYLQKSRQHLQLIKHRLNELTSSSGAGNKKDIATSNNNIHQEDILKRSLSSALLSQKHNLCILWSAKAGCTFTVKWFLYHEGLLQEALDYSPWVHNYRQDIFYNSINYRKRIENPLEILRSQNLMIAKVVRNPYTRAVSSYLHASRSPRLSQPILACLNKGDHEKFSFREFVDYLESTSLETCNIHWQLQQSPAEKSGSLLIHRVIKLEESQISLRELEIELNLKSADMTLLRESGHHTVEIDDGREHCSDVTAFKTEGKNLYRYPYKKFYDLGLQQRILNLYKNDFVAYGYSKNYRYELD
jgi:Sulfotransferase family